jgi:NAD(P)-dependent dehydrogenase (short-subunit alcohol dehydrogenase family)
MIDLRFDGRVALVTGGGRGLGRDYALLLASRGASVIVNDPGVGLPGEARDPQPAQDVANEIVAAGGKAIANFDNADSPEAAAAMVRSALAAFERLDIVVNTGGDCVPRLSAEERASATFEALWRAHVLGALHIVRAAWTHMKAQRYGRIVNTALHADCQGAIGSLEYATANAAVHGLTHALSLESAEHGVSVNTVVFEPGPVPPTAAWLCHEDCHANGESFDSMTLGSGSSSRSAKPPSPGASRPASDQSGKDTKAVYLVGAIDVDNHEGYDAYRRATGPLLMSMDGVEIISADDNPEIFEGRQPANHLFIVKFRDMGTLHNFYYSDAYTAIKRHRIDSSTARFLMGMRSV